MGLILNRTPYSLSRLLPISMFNKIVDIDFSLRYYSIQPWEFWWSRAPYHKLFRGGFIELNDSAIERACSRLGLSYIPRISTYRALRVWQGTSLGTTYLPDHCKPIIAMDFGLNPIAASVTLWHELTHCLQHERDNRVSEAGLRVDSHGWRKYWNQPREKEARQNERYGLEFSLVKGWI